jgi:hypothetical protein
MAGSCGESSERLRLIRLSHKSFRFPVTASILSSSSGPMARQVFVGTPANSVCPASVMTCTVNPASWAFCAISKSSVSLSNTNANLGHSVRQPLLDGMVLCPNLCVTKAMDQEHDAGVCALGDHLAPSHVEIVSNDDDLLESAHRSPGEILNITSCPLYECHVAVGTLLPGHPPKSRLCYQ